MRIDPKVFNQNPAAFNVFKTNGLISEKRIIDGVEHHCWEFLGKGKDDPGRLLIAFPTFVRGLPIEMAATPRNLDVREPWPGSVLRGLTFKIGYDQLVPYMEVQIQMQTDNFISPLVVFFYYDEKNIGGDIPQGDMTLDLLIIEQTENK